MTMTLTMPNLFLADLGPGLTLTPQTIRDACFSVRRNRGNWLAQRRTRELIDLLSFTAEQWLDPQNGFRRRALAEGPEDTGMQPATLARGMDAFFRLLTPEQLEGLVAQDLGDARKLDDFTAGPQEARMGRSSMARGHELLVHVAAGNLPVPAWMSLVMGILTKSAQFVKLPSRGGLLPRLFAHSLAFNESKLGACLEMATWSGGDKELEAALFEEADCVTVTGGDATVADIRSRMPGGTRLVAHGSRLSFGFVPAEALTAYSAKRTAREAASDVSAWNQQGCLSPHVVYIEENGVHSPESFAELLAQELEARERLEPRGALPVETAIQVVSRRELYAMRAGLVPAARERKLDSVFLETTTTLKLWMSEASTAWTIVLDGDPLFRTSCLNRFVYLKPVKNLATALHYAEEVRGRVGAVSLAQSGDRHAELARELANWGVPRICPMGRMQEPPLAWRQDGRPTLADLVNWTDLES